MKALLSRPYSLRQDSQTMHDFMTVCGADEFPIFDWHYLSDDDSRLWFDADGTLIVAALAWSGHVLQFLVHPHARGGDIASEVIAWGALRARAVGRTTFYSRAREDDADRTEVLEKHGFVREESYLLGLSRSLNDTVCQPQLPEGFTIRSFLGEPDAEVWVSMVNGPDEWMTVEQRLFDLEMPIYVAELDLVAVAPDGTFAAHCMGSINRDEGLIDPVGTRPRFRRLGLSRALILTCFQRLRALGIETTTTSVDGENHPARRLYESVGFRPTYKRFVYRKELEH
ncbi:MAG: GNAT family N-acetyltransferase [Candidatus Poribacteria bacterium]|nr:GNAT family N-acetyltransferase [Candidatus Poribacteria bacterium]